jgi:hypothetical protein
MEESLCKLLIRMEEECHELAKDIHNFKVTEDTGRVVEWIERFVRETTWVAYDWQSTLKDYTGEISYE